MTFLNALINKILGYYSIDEFLKNRYLNNSSREPFPRGHFYSPLPDLQFLTEHAGKVFDTALVELPGINLNPTSQANLFDELLSFSKDYSWPVEKSEAYRYFSNNSMFGAASAFFTYSMLRLKQPKRIIEVGSGFSSALMFDTAEKFFTHDIEFEFIEPMIYNSRLTELFSKEDMNCCAFIKDIVQNVPCENFKALEADDILYIDSSHVSKTGSDINHLIFKVLPILKPGVIVHIHDIYWPFEYPKSWVVDNKWAWNEAYLLRAFLQFNNEFEIIFFNDYIYKKYPTRLEESINLKLDNYGSSLWIRKA